MRPGRLNLAFIIATASAIILASAPPTAGPLQATFVGAALADDDGDDGDDGGGAGGSGGGGGGSSGDGSSRSTGGGSFGNPLRGFANRLFGGEPSRRQGRPSNRAMALAPNFVRDQLVAIGISPEQEDLLEAEGYEILSRDALAFLGEDIVKLSPPAGLTLEAARERLRTLSPQAEADFNHYYSPGGDDGCSGPNCVAPRLIGWAIDAAGAGKCGGATSTIGLIDTAINPGHASFVAERVEVLRLAPEALPVSNRRHGTAVAALLVGAAGSATPGLLPEARLVAVDVFSRVGKDDRAEAYDLARAMDFLAHRKVDVMNMSLSGPANELVEMLVERVAADGIVMVAAAGNGGARAQPLFPAGYDAVIAVTAVDERKRAYRRAGQGDHVDFAAPGVGVWAAASISGARPHTGTSFAAPFVTAAAATAKASGLRSASEIQDLLARTAEDLGDAGKDRVFGWGLLDARGLCRRPAE